VLVVHGWVANTDFDWYQFLAGQGPTDEVNFWQPSGGHQSFHAIQPGEPFFFRLKSPRNAIAGFGFFARHVQAVRCSFAWDAFGMKNGAPDIETMRRRVEHYRAPSSVRLGADHEVGCLMISTPVFFSPEQWIAQPSDWQQNIVQGKTYDLTLGEGRRIWEACQRSGQLAEWLRRPQVSDDEAPRYGEPQLVRPRLGQGIFRIAVSDAYGKACAVTNEHSLPVLEAAHIRPYGKQGPHEVSNGLLLRSDIHRLFDDGWVTVTPDFHFLVSRRLREEFDNGKTYYALDGNAIRLPHDPGDRPLPAFLKWHNEAVFRG